MNVKLSGLLAKKTVGVLLSFCLALVLVACGSGTTGHNPGQPTWNYTALGDSLAFGALAQEEYVPRYASYANLDTGANVDTTNLGIPGWHSGDLLNAIQSDGITRNNVSSSQIVTWDIGGNDLANAHDQYKNGTCGGDRRPGLPAQCGLYF